MIRFGWNTVLDVTLYAAVAIISCFWLSLSLLLVRLKCARSTCDVFSLIVTISATPPCSAMYMESPYAFSVLPLDNSCHRKQEIHLANTHSFDVQGQILFLVILF